MCSAQGVANTLVNEPMTYGEKALGITFNPSNDPNVQKVKELYAQIIDLVHHSGGDVISSDRHEMIKTAIREAQTAQMWAVKVITWKY